MRYALLLRGVNVGGNNKVSMAEMKNKLREGGFENVESYINSGNLFFDTEMKLETCRKVAEAVLGSYEFVILYTLFDSEYYNEIANNMPKWW